MAAGSLKEGLGMLSFAVAKMLNGTFVPFGVRGGLACLSFSAGFLYRLQTRAAHLVATAHAASGQAVMKFSLEIAHVLI